MLESLVEVEAPRPRRTAVFSLLLGLAALALSAGLLIHSLTSVAANPEHPSAITANGEALSGNCRYGITPLNETQAAWVQTLGTGWYLNFNSNPFTVNGWDAEYVPMVRVKQSKDGSGNYLNDYYTLPNLTAIQNRVQAFPGQLWILGNEMERGPNYGQPNGDGAQDDIFPEIYATAYHDLYHFIKGLDSTAQISPGGLIQATPGRMQYWDIVWNTYLATFGVPMPVDAWSMHIYVLSEATPDGEDNGIASIALGTDPAIARTESYDPDGNGPRDDSELCPLLDVQCVAEHDDLNAVNEHVYTMRKWLHAHGYRDVPLLVTEYSILWPYIQDSPTSCFIQDEYDNCFTPARVANYASASFNYFENAKDATYGNRLDGNRLVQQWLWFSMYNNNEDQTAYVSNILEDNYQLYAPGAIGALSHVGQQFRAGVLASPLVKNLFVVRTANPVVAILPPATTANVPISVRINNNGNNRIDQTYTVTFYSNAAMTTVISSVQAVLPVDGCARDEVTVSTIWPNRTSGAHPYWVKVDSTSVVVETVETDNVGHGVAIVNPQKVLMPVMRR